MIHCKGIQLIKIELIISAMFSYLNPSHNLYYYRNGFLATLMSGFIFKGLAGTCNSPLPSRLLHITITSEDAHVYIAVVSHFLNYYVILIVSISDMTRIYNQISNSSLLIKSHLLSKSCL